MSLLLRCICLLLIISCSTILSRPNHVQKIPWILLDELSLENRFKHVEICRTGSCIKDAKYLHYFLNKSVDPCEDFYSFVCGGWLKNEKLPDSEASWDTFNLLQQKINNQVLTLLEEPITSFDNLPIRVAKQFYGACQDEAKLEEIGVRPLQEVLHHLHRWPIITRYWYEEDFDLQDAMVAILKMYKLDPFVGVSIETDLKNQSRNIIYINQAAPLFPDSILKDHSVYSEQIKAYVQWIVNSAEELNHENVPIVDIKRDAYEVVNFESKLAEIRTSSENSRDLNKLYNKITIRELQEMTDSFNTVTKIHWLEYFLSIFSGTGINITDGEKIIVMYPEYLQRMLQLFDKTDKRIISNYLLWRIVAKYAKETTKVFRTLSDNIDTVLSGVKEGLGRRVECQMLTTSFFGKAVGYQYLNKFFNENTREKVFQLTYEIHNAFVKELKSLDWMDEVTRSRAVDKAKAMTAVIGYTADYKNLTEMQIEYEKIHMSNDHFKNVLFMNRYEVIDQFKELTANDTKENWDMEPTDINAGYSTTNAIFILAGILQFPFYEQNRLLSMNFGAIGSIIGHEITHGFDDIGRQFDKNGNLVQWWSEKTVDTYNFKAECFVNQFDTMRVPELDLITQSEATLNGRRTLGENIADSGGVNTAFRAYLSYVNKNGPEKHLPGDLAKYTPEQLFFISYGMSWCEILTNEELAVQVSKDEHAPNKYRVLTSLKNSKYFSETFNCPKNSAMNPEHKCQLW